MHKGSDYATYYAPDISASNFKDERMMLPTTDHLLKMHPIDGVNKPYIYIGLFVLFLFLLFFPFFWF